jgi:hypothetical protein
LVLEQPTLAAPNIYTGALDIPLTDNHLEKQSGTFPTFLVWSIRTANSIDPHDLGTICTFRE